jgi:hypothetical protein
MATWIQKWFKISAGASRKLYSIYNSFPGRGDGRGYIIKICVKHKAPGGSEPGLFHWHGADPPNFKKIGPAGPTTGAAAPDPAWGSAPNPRKILKIFQAVEVR